jgi:hypothetical protein
MNLVENKRSRYRNQAAGRVLAVLCAFTARSPRSRAKILSRATPRANFINSAIAGSRSTSAR